MKHVRKKVINQIMRIERYAIGTRVYIEPMVGLGLKATIEVSDQYPEGVCYHGDNGKYYDDTDLYSVHCL